VGLSAALLRCGRWQGRSCTIVLCYLMHTYGWTAAQAMAYLKRRRPECAAEIVHMYVVHNLEKRVLALQNEAKRN
jgi:protein-tyrosine phosphatase